MAVADTYIIHSNELTDSFAKHAEDHYSEYTIGVYPVENDTAVAVALVANKYSPSNCW